MVSVNRRQLMALGLAGGASLAVTRGAGAQDVFPSRSVRVVIPYPVGGSTDIVGRLMAEQMTRELGQSVLIDNRPGGGTNIGAEAVVNAKPDGYTMLFGGVNQVVNPTFGPIPSFDLLNTLEPVGQLANAPFMVAAHPSMPFSTARDFLTAAKAQPGKLSVSSAQLDLYVELMTLRAGISLLHVPYKGGAQAATDAIGGQVNMVFAQVPALLQHIRNGRLKPLFVTANKRWPSLPDTPTLMELGIDYDVNPWFALMAPAGTPKPIIERVSQALEKSMKHPDIVQKVQNAGANPAFLNPPDTVAMVRAQLAFWQQVGKSLPHLVAKR